jgi:hypothetical protein
MTAIKTFRAMYAGENDPPIDGRHFSAPRGSPALRHAS